MKRLAIAAMAAVMAVPVGLPTPAAAQRYDRDRDRHWDRDDDDDDRDRRRHRRHRGDRDWRDDDRREHRRWDRRRFNGYNYRGRWHYGPPPARWAPYADYGYRNWRRGDRLPAYYRDSYYVVRDYDRYGLRRPPRGYHYVRDDRGDYLLVGIATGVILGVILANSG
jgi:Ni/Co efflux regulator RcnB